MFCVSYPSRGWGWGGHSKLHLQVIYRPVLLTSVSHTTTQHLQAGASGILPHFPAFRSSGSSSLPAAISNTEPEL